MTVVSRRRHAGPVVRWRRPTAAELPTIVARLENWDAAPSGLARHANVLEAIERQGVSELLVATDKGRWGVVFLSANGVAVPCGDPQLFTAAPPLPAWRLLVGATDVAAAALANGPAQPATIVHEQAFYTLDTTVFRDLIAPGDAALRVATVDDLDGLADLAVQLHVDDGFGPDPGWRGVRGYRHRFEQIIADERVFCVGPIGQPIAKIERSEPSGRYGVQFSGIVVDRAHRGEGIATCALFEAVRQTVSTPAISGPVSLHLRSKNDAARTVYERVGFRFQEPWMLAIRP
ncbi:MAG: GNAT family N-acetyltransferase [Nitriliruptoraceae bacterium]